MHIWKTLALFFATASGLTKCPSKLLRRHHILSSTIDSIPKMGRKTRVNPYIEAEYSVVDGMRSVIPYVHTFTTHAKGRWIGREIMDVLTREFGGHPPEYWKNAIKFGHVRINNNIVEETYRFKNSDAMIHRTHRHEPTVAGDILFVGETDKIMAVAKPPSIPVHPSGAYRFNSLMFILAKEPMIKDQPQLHLVHRLDRVTSGLVILAKSKETAAVLSQEIRDKSTEKTYLARVKGQFPARLHRFRTLKLEELQQAIALSAEELDNDNDDNDIGNSRNNNSNSNSNSCRNEGKNEGLGDSDSNGNDNDNGNPSRKRKADDCGADTDIGNDNAPGTDAMSLENQQSPVDSHQSREGNGKHKNKHAQQLQNQQQKQLQKNKQQQQQQQPPSLPPVFRIAPSLDEVVASDRVGCYTDETTGEITLCCPLGCMSFREGIHACDPASGKTSVTIFNMLGYDPHTDTSLVECRPVTGRTHQIRIHLQALGNSIANDPCYGGELFYGEPEKRVRALEVLRKMRREGKHPLSKVPHLGDPELDLKPLPLAHTSGTPGASSSSSAAASAGAAAVTTAAATAVSGEGPAESTNEAARTSYFAVIEPQQPGESDNDYLIRTCKYCRQEKESQELERLLHCDGIWLHALQYKGDGWGFRSPEPKWALLDTFRKVPETM